MHQNQIEAQIMKKLLFFFPWLVLLNILVCEGNTPDEGKKFKDAGIATHTESLKESLVHFNKNLNIDVLNPCLELDVNSIVPNLKK